MRNTILTCLGLLACTILTSCSSSADDFRPDTIIAMERAALDRWDHGDPGGYLDIYGPEVTYFDPFLGKRIDGLEAMRKYLEPFKGKVNVARFDMIDPKVQRRGDAAVLTFNLVSYGKKPDGGEIALARWNATKVYAKNEGQWRILHEHWSFTQPELKQPVKE